jgi:hypothetical protein
MSAVILPFKGRGEPEAVTPPKPAEARALHDARLIMAAKRANDDWTARLLLALLQTLGSKQLRLLEFRLLGHNLDSESAVQALALVELTTGNVDHRRRVEKALVSLTGADQ